MKFGKTLKENAIDAWRRQYINYRLLKKLISRAQQASENPKLPTPLLEEPEGEDEEEEADDEEANVGLPTSSRFISPSNVNRPSYFTSPLSTSPTPVSTMNIRRSVPNSSGETSPRRSSISETASTTAILPKSKSKRKIFPGKKATDSGGEDPLGANGVDNQKLSRRPTLSNTISTIWRKNSNRDLGENKKAENKAQSFRKPRLRWPPKTPLPEIYGELLPQEQKFFFQLDKEFEKVEAFYKEREAEAERKFKELEEQLEELERRRELKHDSHSVPHTFSLPLSITNSSLSTSKTQLESRQSSQSHHASPPHSDSDPEDDGFKVSAIRQRRKARQRVLTLAKKAGGMGKAEAYKAAKDTLKEAVFEYYQYLGYVRNYKEYNQTGFAKILKKFEKVLHVPCSYYYLNQVLKPSTFFSSTKISELQDQTVDIFSKYFESGNRKKALGKLRVDSAHQTKYLHVLRGGLYLGVGVVLMIEGIVWSFHPSVRENIPAWPALMQIHGALFLPIFFLLLFQLNLIAWQKARINYVLIFEFDPRSVMDFRTFFEFPAFLFLLLTAGFWFTFFVGWEWRIWNGVWVIASLVFWANPLRIWHRSGRYWLVKALARVFTGGFFPVVFSDFFLGDQLTSLYYLLYNLGFIVCSYHYNWSGVPTDHCGTNSTWSSAILSTLPNLLRLTQSIRRYLDSQGNIVHMLNAGKYSVGIIYYFVYYNWRINARSQDGASKAIWIVFGCINAIYSATWDIKMDWNLLQKKAKYPLLRKELAYSDRIWFYYFAMITDILGRFSWLLYLDPNSDTLTVRGFTTAVIEVLRRWQWNFLRVESEHIGNVDGYRVTREVPLPYVLHEPKESTEFEEEDLISKAGQFVRKTLVRKLTGKVEETVESGGGILGKVSKAKLAGKDDSSDTAGGEDGTGEDSDDERERELTTVERTSRQESSMH